MDSKALTENGWKAVATKFKIKDNGLQKALAGYGHLKEEEYDDRVKYVGLIGKLADVLKKTKEVTAQPDAVKYLTDMVAEAADAKEEIVKEKTQALKAQAEAEKKAAADARANAEDDEEEQEQGAFHEKLWKALQRLKSAKGVTWEFIVCDAKPCGVMLAKKILSKHRDELTKVTGSRRFLPIGTCEFENGKYIFSLVKPVPGLARKMQESIKHFVGKKLPIVVGTETAEAEEEQQEQAAGGPAPAPKPELAQAPAAWHQTRQNIDDTIGELKSAILKQFADQGKDILAQIEAGLKRLDTILEKLDHRLAVSLTKANAEPNPTARQAELKKSKAILTDYINFVKGEPLIAHIDANPFGVKTNLKQSLATSLTQMARAIG